MKNNTLSLRILTIKTVLALTILLSLISFSGYSTHIVGGELNYKCLGGNLYEIRLRVYRDCFTGVPPFDNPAAVGVFGSNNVLITTVLLNFPGSTKLPPTLAQVNPCIKTPNNICVEVAEYVGTVTLPPRAGGYQLSYQRCCRNPTLTNITNPGNQGATYYAAIPDQAVVACNSNPVFKNWPPLFVCANNPVVFDHSATDGDGDSIYYDICTPFTSGSGNPQPNPPANPPYTPITWQAPYNTSNVLGGIPLTINPKTGLLVGIPNTIGQFVVGICATEYRNGVLLSTTKRDFQFNVIACQPDVSAAAASYTSDCTNHTVTFTNTSVGATSYLWNFGDLTTLGDTSTVTSPTYTYPSVGAYTVKLIAFNSSNSACNDTLLLTIQVDTCRPCGMNVNITTTDGVCNATVGCYRVKYVQPCVGTGVTYTYGTSGSVNCNSTTLNSGGALPGGTYSFFMNGVALPSPSTVTTLTPVAGTCSKYLNIQNVGGVSTVEFNTMTAAPQTGGATATITGGNPPYTVNWTTTPAQVTTGTPSSTTPIPPGLYTAIIIDAQGCTETRTFVVNGNSTLNFTPSKTDVTGCGLNNGTLSAGTVTGSTGTVTYLWSPGGWTTANVNNVAPGTYTVLVNDGALCPKSATVVVGGIPAITVTASKTDVLCNTPANGTATANLPTGGTAPYTYSWNTIPIQTNATATGLTAGYYVVTATDNSGCTGSALVNVANSYLTLTSSKIDVKCYGDNSGSISITATSGSPGYIYSWNSMPVQTTATASGLTVGTYVGVVTDNAGCKDSVTYTISQPNPIVPEPKNTSTITCGGVPTGSGQVLVSGGVKPYTYLWCNASSLSTATGLSPGYCVVTVTDSNLCVVTDSINIVFPTPLSITTTPFDVSCNGGNDGSAIVNPIGGQLPYKYSWTPIVPAQINQTATNLTAGTYVIVVTDSLGCTASQNVIISQPSVLTIVKSGTDVVCFGQNNGAASITASGGTPAYIYSWNTTPVQTTSNITSLTTGTYIVSVTDNKGCTNSASVTVNQPTAFTLTPSHTNLICNGVNTGIATVTSSGGNTGTVSYSWSPISKTTQTVTGLSAGTYVVTATDPKGCSASQSIIVTQPSKITIAKDSTTTGCGATGVGSATITASGGTPGYTYVWSTSPLQTGNSATGLSAGTYTVVVADANNCSSTAKVTIVSLGPGLAVANFTAAYQPTCKDGVEVSFTNLSTSATSYLWIFGDGTTSTDVNPAHVYPYGTNTTVQLVAFNGGCSDTMSLNLAINPFSAYISPFVPNVFTPNGDMQNDCFEVKVGNGLDNCVEIIIFDRWGLKMYENDNGVCWDGKTKSGKAVPVGTYFYLIKIGENEMHGALTLLR